MVCRRFGSTEKRLIDVEISDERARSVVNRSDLCYCMLVFIWFSFFFSLIQLRCDVPNRRGCKRFVNSVIRLYVRQMRRADICSMYIRRVRPSYAVR